MAMTPEFQAFMEEHFSLDNYLRISELDLEGWYDQFMKRNFIRFRLKKHPNFPSSLLEKVSQIHERSDDDNELKTEIATIFSNPLYCSNSSWWKMTGLETTPTRDWQGYDYWLRAKEISLQPEAFTELENNYQLAHKAGKDFPMNGWENYDLETLQRVGSSFQRFTKARNINYQPLAYGSRESDLKVNLLYPDEVLKESFSAWLSEARSKMYFNGRQDSSNTKRSFKHSDTKSWIKYKTLQYLDLELASIVFNSPLNAEERTFFLLPELPIAASGRDKMRAYKIHADKMSDYVSIARLKLGYERNDGGT